MEMRESYVHGRPYGGLKTNFQVKPFCSNSCLKNEPNSKLIYYKLQKVKAEYLQAKEILILVPLPFFYLNLYHLLLTGKLIFPPLKLLGLS